MKVKDLGLISVLEAQKLQIEEREKIFEGRSQGCIFICEHPHTVTLGRKLEKQASKYRSFLPQEIEVVPLNRGGEATYHGPGQIVVYPVFSLFEKKMSVKEYIATLENGVINFLKNYGIKAYSNPEHRGVWVQDQKILSLGVHISRGVSIHGIALNVNCNLKYFSYFEPCGLCHTQITSMKEVLRGEVDFMDIKRQIIETFSSW
ncbi:MAG: lipoyl(octanoyl) transferase LipB [Deltaproteobacteria bacterium]|nr:lipoyl(octanoyl) transferase LipB [Deltaproteobacteria bacterium]